MKKSKKASWLYDAKKSKTRTKVKRAVAKELRAQTRKEIQDGEIH